MTQFLFLKINNDYIMENPHQQSGNQIQSSVVRAFVHGAMGHQIDPSWGGPIELFLVPASAPWLV